MHLKGHGGHAGFGRHVPLHVQGGIFLGQLHFLCDHLDLRADHRQKLLLDQLVVGQVLGVDLRDAS